MSGPSSPAVTSSWRRSDFWYDGKRQFFIVLSVGTDPAHPGLLRFVDSCATQRVPVRVLGRNRPWQGGDMANGPGGGQKVNLLKEELRGLREILPEIFANLLILFTDGYDVCMVAPVEEILSKYRAFERQIVFSSEVCCWPDDDLATQYPLAPGGSPFRYLNSGGFMGPAADIFNLLLPETIRDEDDDQRYYTSLFLNPRSTDAHQGVALDYRCEIFQTLNHVAAGQVAFSTHRAENRLFHTHPCVIHANGPDHVARPLERLVVARPALHIERPRSSRAIHHVIVINMEHRVEKRAAMERQLHDCLHDRPDVTVDFFPAINGQTLTPAALLERGGDIDRTWVNPYNNQPLTHGEVGCALSHHAVWTRVRDGQWPNVLVLEDDVILPRDLMHMLEARMAELDDPWDLAYIGRKPLRRGEHRLSENTVIPKYSYWTNGYVLNKAGAEKLLATDFIQHIIPVDEYLPLLCHSHFDPRRIKHYARFSPLLAVAFDPVLICPIDDTFQESDTEHSPPFDR